MFKSEPNRDAGLEWTLQNNQVSDSALMDALVGAYYQPVYHLALTLWDDRPAARRLAHDTFTTAVIQRRRYWGEAPLRLWLFALALNLYRHSQRAGLRQARSQLRQIFHRKESEDEAAFPSRLLALPQKERLALTLRYGQHLAAAEAAYVLSGKLEEKQIEAFLSALRRARQKLFPAWQAVTAQPLEPPHVHTLLLAVSDGVGSSWAQAEIDQHQKECLTCQAFSSKVNDLNAAIRQAFTDAWPEETAPQGELPAWVGQASGKVAKHESRQRAVTAVRNGLAGLLAALLVGIFAWWSMRATPADLATMQVRPSSSPTPDLPGLTADREVAFYYQYAAQPGDTLNQIAEWAGVSVAALRAANGRDLQDPLEPGEQLTIPSSRSLLWLENMPLVTPEPLPAPLTEASSEAEIRQRIENSFNYFRTLWVDVRYTDYGTAGYIGPPLSSGRLQSWISMPSFGVIIQQYSDGNDTSVVPYFVLNNIGFWKDSQSGTIYGGSVMSPGDQSGLTSVLPLNSGPAEGEFEVVGTDVIAGRPALRCEHLQPTGGVILRFWVDSALGLILRQEYVSAKTPDTVTAEVVVTDLQIDVELPANIFNPATFPLKGPAANYHADPESPEQIAASNNWRSLYSRQAPEGHRPPPPGAQLWEEPVRMVWPDPQASEGWAEDGFKIEVYAGEYSLGEASLETTESLAVSQKPTNYTFSSCTRSQNGRSIALNVNAIFGTTYPFSRTYLYWFTLDPPLHFHRALEQDYPNGDFAFSPDGSRLVTWGCVAGSESIGGGCGLRMIDTNSGEVTFVRLNAKEGTSWTSQFVWSPDAKSLAMIRNSSFTPSESYFSIFDLSTGEETYVAPFNWDNPVIPADAPIHDWGIDYDPAAYTGMPVGCQLP